MFSLLVLAADIPDALPAGFLEQLPAMLQMRDEEYEALLKFMQSPEASGSIEPPATGLASDPASDPTSAEETTHVNE